MVRKDKLSRNKYRKIKLFCIKISKNYCIVHQCTVYNKTVGVSGRIFMKKKPDERNNFKQCVIMCLQLDMRLFIKK